QREAVIETIDRSGMKVRCVEPSGGARARNREPLVDRVRNGCTDLRFHRRRRRWNAGTPSRNDAGFTRKDENCRTARAILRYDEAATAVVEDEAGRGSSGDGDY